MSASTFKPTIISALEELSQLVDVFDYARGKSSGYPFAFVVANSTEEEPFLMGKVNKQTHEFSIKVYDEMSDPDATEQRIETLKDLIIEKLSEANFKAIGSLREKIAPTSRQTVEVENGAARELEILLTIEEKVRR